MTRRAILLPIKTHLTIVAALAVSTALPCLSQQSSPESRKGKTAAEAGKHADEQARREAEQVIREIDLEIFRDDKWIKVERIEKPLLFYSDPTRHDDRGSVWGWGKKGRPMALIEFYRGATNPKGWTFAICNTSGGKLRAHQAGALWWNENDSAAEIKRIPSASAPAPEPRVRQRQLKQLAQKFAAHELFEPKDTRYDLRLLERPLYTYRDETGAVLDGAVFTFAHGTNPEIMLFIEARVDLKDRSKSVWQYTIGRSSNAEWYLEYDGKEIFHAPPMHGVFASDKPYFFGYITAALDAEPRKP